MLDSPRLTSNSCSLSISAVQITLHVVLLYSNAPTLLRFLLVRIEAVAHYLDRFRRATGALSIFRSCSILARSPKALEFAHEQVCDYLDWLSLRSGSRSTSKWCLGLAAIGQHSLARSHTFTRRHSEEDWPSWCVEHVLDICAHCIQKIRNI